MVKACGASAEADTNPAVILGAIMGAAAFRDATKLTNRRLNRITPGFVSAAADAPQKPLHFERVVQEFGNVDAHHRAEEHAEIEARSSARRCWSP